MAVPVPPHPVELRIRHALLRAVAEHRLPLSVRQVEVLARAAAGALPRQRDRERVQRGQRHSGRRKGPPPDSARGAAPGGRDAAAPRSWAPNRF